MQSEGKVVPVLN